MLHTKDCFMKNSIDKSQENCFCFSYKVKAFSAECSLRKKLAKQTTFGVNWKNNEEEYREFVFLYLVSNLQCGTTHAMQKGSEPEKNATRMFKM